MSLEKFLAIDFTGERIVPGAPGCEPTFAQKMYQEHLARYAFASQLVEQKDVLDLGCGVGYGSQLLAMAGAKSVLGVDIAEDAIDHARKNYFHSSVTFVSKDALTLTLADQFDVVTCFEFIEHVTEQHRVLDIIKRALRPNGTVIISTPRPLDDLRTHFHAHELNFEELQQMLTERFVDVQSYFERNCFTSFIGTDSPHELRRIVPVSDKLNMSGADYFIFVAYAENAAERAQLEPTLTLNDDSYILRLEQDVENLRNGESYHNGLIADLSKRVEDTSRELADHRQRADGDRVISEQLSKLVEASASTQQLLLDQHAAYEVQRNVLVKEKDELVAALKQDLEVRIASGESLVRQNEQLQGENRKLEADIEQLRMDIRRLEMDNEQLTTDNYVIRSKLAEISEQLAESQTKLHATAQASEAVAGLRMELDQTRTNLHRELDELRRRHEQSEATLSRFRRSVSWKVTRPIRWVGRTLGITARSAR